ncbi:AEC family transporter [Dendrosporobacter sp. 1207_IL3150]|uniref:AEC family transporter n=1 Tax=Dendrosporobacter sp. 1207_IL3150 TaxID=3084054 RepID=UPI002FD917FF
MDVSLKLNYFLIDLILPLTAGYYLRSTRFHNKYLDKMISVCFSTLFPFLAILTFWVLRPAMELFWLPLFGVILHIIPGLISFYYARKHYTSGTDIGSFVLAGMLSNLLTLGGISVFILYGERGFAYVQLVVLFQNLILFLFCFPLAQYFAQRDTDSDGQGIRWRSLFNRNQLTVVGMIIGAYLNWADYLRPDYLGNAVDWLIHITAWLTLIPVGHSIDFTQIRQYWRSTVDILVIKFILTPIAIFGLARIIFTDTIVFNTLMLLSFAPSAINAVIAVRLHQLNIHLVMASFVLTTAVYLLVVYPVIFFYLR